jgi:uncharacterized glyoxalase superfamily protein PhnB
MKAFQPYLNLDRSVLGARFGMLADKFGVNSMLNCELKK